jgi:RP/EB family microtubule-associated protein
MTSIRRAADIPLGMMDGAYFTSRKDILDFFNSLLSMNLKKIEDTASGAVACQLMDYMFPGSIPMKRVNWAAKSDFQFIENYKILQASFSKSNVQKQVDVDRLIRAKYQDNLEFCQWLKAFFEHAAPASREDYDPLSRRQMGKGGKSLDDLFLPRGMKRNGARPSMSVRNGGSVTSTSRGRTSSRPSTAGSVRTSTLRTGPITTSTSSRQSIMPKRSIDSADAELLKKNTELKRKNAEIELTLDNIERERDFYFDKLRGIEVMLQVHEENGEESDPEALIQRIYKVLYAKLEDDIVVTDEGELLENEDDEGLNDESVITMDDDLMD